VLAMIALRIRKAIEPLFEERIVLVPQRQPETQALKEVGDSEQAVFAPTIRARACMVVRQIRPRVAIVAVILAHRAPLARAQVRSPAPPRRRMFRILEHPAFFSGRRGSRVLVRHAIQPWANLRLRPPARAAPGGPRDPEEVRIVYTVRS